MDLGVFNDVKQGFPTCGPWKVFKIKCKSLFLL